MEPLLAGDVDVSKITYGTPRTLDSGAKHIRLNYNRSALIVQTPDMVSPFGINKWDNPGGASKHTLELSFKDIEDREDLQVFKQFLGALDKKLVDDAFDGVLPTHSKKFTSRDVVDVLYQPGVKVAKDEKYAPNFKVTLPVGDKEEFSFPTYVLEPKTRQPKVVDLKAIVTKGAVCTVIMQCTGIWVANSNFGCTWKVTQLRVQPPISRTDYAFKNVGALLDPSAEEDIDEDRGDEKALDKQLAAQDDAQEDDEDEEEEEDEEDGDDEMEAPVVAVAAVQKGKAAAAQPKPRARAK